MRKTKEVKIEEGRDAGKSFLITEMSARRGDRWAIRVLMAIARNGIGLPPETIQQGIAGLAILGVSALAMADFADLEPLLDELEECIQISEKAGPRRLTDDDIEDGSTIQRLRREALELHWDFLKAVVPSK
jgi:hypothetical protein